MTRTLRFVARRVAFAVPQIFAMSLVTFMIIRLLPGNPAFELAGTQATPEVIRSIEQDLGLDKPIYVQYGIYLKNLLNGDWGRSWYTGRAVTTDLATRLPATLELVSLAAVLIIVFGIGLGALAGFSRLRFVDPLVKTYGRLAGGFPDFWLGLVAAFLFFFVLGWAPSPTGQLAPGVPRPDRVTGMVVVDSLLAGDWGAFSSAAGHLVLPVATLVLVYMAPILKLTSSTVEEMARSEFCRYARACGLSDWTVLRYALRNSLPPSVAMVGVIYGFLLGGAVLVENVYSWGGLGSYVVSAIQHSDYFAIQAFVLVSAVVNLVVYLLVDLVYFWIDPRVMA